MSNTITRLTEALEGASPAQVIRVLRNEVIRPLIKRHHPGPAGMTVEHADDVLQEVFSALVGQHWAGPLGLLMGEDSQVEVDRMLEAHHVTVFGWRELRDAAEREVQRQGAEGAVAQPEPWALVDTFLRRGRGAQLADEHPRSFLRVDACLAGLSSPRRITVMLAAGYAESVGTIAEALELEPRPGSTAEQCARDMWEGALGNIGKAYASAITDEKLPRYALLMASRWEGRDVIIDRKRRAAAKKRGGDFTRQPEETLLGLMGERESGGPGDLEHVDICLWRMDAGASNSGADSLAAMFVARAIFDLTIAEVARLFDMTEGLSRRRLDHAQRICETQADWEGPLDPAHVGYARAVLERLTPRRRNA